MMEKTCECPFVDMDSLAFLYYLFQVQQDVWPPTEGTPVYQNITADVTNGDVELGSGAINNK
jgi:hypothetical protein